MRPDPNSATFELEVIDSGNRDSTSFHVTFEMDLPRRNRLKGRILRNDQIYRVHKWPQR